MGMSGDTLQHAVHVEWTVNKINTVPDVVPCISKGSSYDGTHVLCTTAREIVVQGGSMRLYGLLMRVCRRLRNELSGDDQCIQEVIHAWGYMPERCIRSIFPFPNSTKLARTPTYLPGTHVDEGVHVLPQKPRVRRVNMVTAQHALETCLQARDVAKIRSRSTRYDERDSIVATLSAMQEVKFRRAAIQREAWKLRRFGKWCIYWSSIAELIDFKKSAGLNFYNDSPRRLPEPFLTMTIMGADFPANVKRYAHISQHNLSLFQREWDAFQLQPLKNWTCDTTRERVWINYGWNLVPCKVYIMKMLSGMYAGELPVDIEFVRITSRIYCHPDGTPRAFANMSVLTRGDSFVILRHMLKWEFYLHHRTNYLDIRRTFRGNIRDEVVRKLIPLEQTLVRAPISGTAYHASFMVHTAADQYAAWYAEQQEIALHMWQTALGVYTVM